MPPLPVSSPISTAAGGAQSEQGVTTEVSYENGLLSLRAVRADIHALMAAIDKHFEHPAHMPARACPLRLRRIAERC